MDTVAISSESLYGNKYFISILDDYTRFGWVLFIKSKDQVFTEFEKWYNSIKNIFGKTIKHLRTDNGTEFTNNKILEFCNQNGIIHEFSVPYDPQQNGKIERLHGSLLPNARAMLEDAQLNHVFWEDAINIANYIFNRMPHKGIDNKIPYELLYNEQVDYNKFKVFGCQAFFYVPKQFRKKLSNSTLPGIFLGYDNNPTAFKIYDTTNNKIVISRSVVFFEDTPGNGSAPTSSPDLINLIPYYVSEGSEDDSDVVEFSQVFTHNQSNQNTNNNNNNDNNTMDVNNNMNENNANLNMNNNNNNNDNNLNNNHPQSNNQMSNYQNQSYNQNYYNPNIPNQYYPPPFYYQNYPIPPYYNNIKQNFPPHILNLPNDHSNNYGNLNNNFDQNNLNQYYQNNSNINFNNNNLNNLNQNNLNQNNLNQNNLNQNNLNQNNLNRNNLNQNNPSENSNQINPNGNANENNLNSNQDKSNNSNKIPQNILNQIKKEIQDSIDQERKKNNSSNSNDVNNKNVSNENLNLSNKRPFDVENLVDNINKPNQVNNNPNNNDVNKQLNANAKRPFDLDNIIGNNNLNRKNDEKNEVNNEVNNQVSKANVSTQENTSNNYNKVIKKPKTKRKHKKENEDDNDEKFKKFKASSFFNLIALSCEKIEELQLPQTYKDIFSRIDKEKWLKAIEEELNNMKNKKVYKFVKSVPKGKHIISARWVFSYKKNDVGIIIRFKARLVARGFVQIYGVDYIETFSPTLKQDSLRIIIAISVYLDFSIFQIDIKAAYLNADLDEELYMEIPEGSSDYGKGYWKLEKAIYGLKQAGRMWNNKLNDILIKIGFERLQSEPCVYVKKNKHNKIICIIAVYVDDMLIAGKKKDVEIIKSEIKNQFELSDLGMVDYIIGIKFIKCEDGYFIHQQQYLNEILERFNIDKYQQVSNMMYIEDKNQREKKFNKTTYMQAVGSLLYLAMGTRPDIMYATSKASRKNQDPTYEDWMNVVRIFRYLKGTMNYGIKITNDIRLRVYVDADLGGDKVTRRSTTGFVIFMGNTPVTWFSKLQHCVSISTAESEYYSLTECALKCMWLRNLLNELCIKTKCITINIDNKAAIYNSNNETINPKSRHIDLRYHKRTYKEWKSRA